MKINSQTGAGKMIQNKLVAYYRVSTAKQEESGLGLDAQKESIQIFARENNYQIVGEYTDIESGTNNDRPELAKAILNVKRIKNCSLIVKTQCRLARRLSKAITIFESVPVLVSNNPNMSMLEIQLRAIIDEEEARRISERTKAALKQAKLRGIKLGTPENLSKEAQQKGAASNLEKAKIRNIQESRLIEDMRREGLSINAIAKKLNSDGIPTPNGGVWSASQVQRIMKRFNIS